MATIGKYLELSTVHLTVETRDYLRDYLVECGIYAWPTVYAHPDGFGWFVYVPSEGLEEYASYTVGVDLQTAIDYARSLGCDYIHFDWDAYIDPLLPTYE